MSKGKVLVGLRDAEHVDSLVKLACEMSKGMKADLIALHVLELIPALPFEAGTEVVDRKNKEILARARHVASQNSCKHISTELIRAHHAGEAIVKNAREHGDDLIILGYHDRYGWGEILARRSSMSPTAHHAGSSFKFFRSTSARVGLRSILIPPSQSRWVA